MMLGDVVLVGLEGGCWITSPSILSTLTSFFHHPLLPAIWQISTFYFVSIRHLWTKLWGFVGMGVDGLVVALSAAAKCWPSYLTLS